MMPLKELKIKKWKIQPWKNKPFKSEMARFKRDAHSNKKPSFI